ncbi:hypothetical protein JHW38_00005 [Lysobacter enzymogenes]|nr:hypothetical protein JHW38_00005 [Lysobacter enzymogenes]
MNDRALGKLWKSQVQRCNCAREFFVCCFDFALHDYDDQVAFHAACLHPKGSCGVYVADDPTLPGYLIAKAANDDRLPRAIRITLANGAVLLYNAYISLSTIPSLTVNELMSVQVTLSLLAEPVRYAS